LSLQGKGKEVIFAASMFEAEKINVPTGAIAPLASLLFYARSSIPVLHEPGAAPIAIHLLTD
jgi:hypothetical protein